MNMEEEKACYARMMMEIEKEVNDGIDKYIDENLGRLKNEHKDMNKTALYCLVVLKALADMQNKMNMEEKITCGVSNYDFHKMMYLGNKKLPLLKKLMPPPNPHHT